MATWVPVNKVATFPAVINAYARAGGGEGNTTGVAKKGFLKTVYAALAAAAAWVRKPPTGAAVSKQDSQVDVTAIPGVKPLRKDGKWTKFPN